VRADIAFKVGDDAESIVNAGQRFLSDQSQMWVLTGRIFAGHNAAIQREAQIAQARANQAAADAQQESQRNQANPNPATRRLTDDFVRDWYGRGLGASGYVWADRLRLGRAVSCEVYRRL
jgi:hypothetical protein